MEIALNNVSRDVLANKLLKLFNQYDFVEINDGEAKARCADIIIDEIAEAFKTNNQTVKSRLVELGFVKFWKLPNNPLYTISPKDAFQEYCENDEFRRIIDRQHFRYAEGTLIDSTYVVVDEKGVPTLGEFAKANLEICALGFVLDENILVHSLNRDILFYSDEFKSKLKPKFEISDNMLALRRAELIRCNVPPPAKQISNVKKDFESKYTQYTKTAKTFSERVCEHMEARNWTVHDFTDRTDLDERAYYRITSGQTKSPTIKTVLAISIGLRLSSTERADLFSLAGHSLKKSKEHFAYTFIFDVYYIDSVEDFNNAYLELGVEPNAMAPL